MNPGLRYLLRKGAVGRVRSLKRRLRGWKGIVLGLLVGFFVLLIVATQMLPRFFEDAHAQGLPVEVFRLYGPLALLFALLLTAASGRGLYFKPPEIAFLFPAPIPRRELLIYNVLSRAGMTLISGLWMSLFVFAREGSAIGTIVAYCLLMFYLQVWQQFTAVLGGAINERLGRASLVLKVVGFAGLAFAGWHALQGAAPGGGLEGTVRTLQDAPVFSALTWFTRPYVELLVTQEVGPWFAWFALAVGIPAAMIGLILWLDLAYQEAAVQRSQKIQQRLQRMKSGGAFAGSQSGSRHRLPRFPRMGGAGPIAWRQCVAMTRNLRGLMTALTFIGFLVGAIVAVPMLVEDVQADLDADKMAWFAIGMILFVSLIMTQNFAFDFRRDLDRMAYLKSLPVSTRAVAVGQLIPATIAQLLVQFVGIFAVVALTQGISVGAVFAMLVLLPPINWATACLDNAVFLFIPYRLVTDDPGNLPFMGRMMIVMLLKFITYAVLGGAAAAAFIASYKLAGDSLVVGTAAATLVAVGLCVPLTLLVAWAFARFDVATDIPE